MRVRILVSEAERRIEIGSAECLKTFQGLPERKGGPTADPSYRVTRYSRIELHRDHHDECAPLTTAVALHRTLHHRAIPVAVRSCRLLAHMKAHTAAGQRSVKGAACASSSRVVRVSAHALPRPSLIKKASSSLIERQLIVPGAHRTLGIRAAAGPQTSEVVPAMSARQDNVLRVYFVRKDKEYSVRSAPSPGTTCAVLLHHHHLPHAPQPVPEPFPVYSLRRQGLGTAYIR